MDVRHVLGVLGSTRVHALLTELEEALASVQRESGEEQQQGGVRLCRRALVIWLASHFTSSALSQLLESGWADGRADAAEVVGFALAAARSIEGIVAGLSTAVPSTAHTLHENALLRRAVQEVWLGLPRIGHLEEEPVSESTSSMAKVRVASNIKLFAGHKARVYYHDKLHHVLDTWEDRVELMLSEEDPELYRHDLVGLLEILHRLRQEGEENGYDPFTLSSDYPLIVVLDGGRKSRNYILTMFYGYQGLYPLLGTLAWQASVESGLSLGAQFPECGREWMILSSSDYDLYPENVTFGNEELCCLPDDADFVLFSVVPDEDVHLRRYAPMLRSILTADMDTAQAMAVLTSLAEERKDPIFLTVARQLAHLTTKGVILADDQGVLLEFREKPRPSVLLEMASRGRVLENIMYAGVHKRRLQSLLDGFSGIQSESVPGELRKVVPFGFYATLFGSVTITEEEFLEEWTRMKPGQAYAEAWSADGRRIRRQALAVMDGCRCYVASFGVTPIVSDLGEPKFYLRAVEARAFSFEGRIRSALCPVSSPHLPPSLDVDDCSHFVLHRSVVDGPGRVVVRTSVSRIVITQSILRIPEGMTLILGGVDDDVSHESKKKGMILIESSYIACGGVLVGCDCLIAGFDSRGGYANNEDTDVTLDLVVRESLIVTTPSLCARAEQRRYGRTHSFPLRKIANRPDPKSQIRPLDIPCFGGRNFFEACEDCDFERLQQRREELP